MSYRFVKGKWVICKDGVYFALTDAEVAELQVLLADIVSGEKLFYKEDARK